MSNLRRTFAELAKAAQSKRRKALKRSGSIASEVLHVSFEENMIIQDQPPAFHPYLNTERTHLCGVRIEVTA